MCGVVGVVGGLANRPEGRAWVEDSLRAIGPRGPDATGLHAAANVLLGHRRLAIRDLSEAGAQPMQSADQRAWIAYNGEVYDTGRLSERLQAQGWRPRGHADTEVVLEYLLSAGVAEAPLQDPKLAAFGELNGMYGLALWHTESATLTLARDRAGIKPLYVAELDDGLAFCSEPAPLYKCPGVDRKLDPDALSLYLALSFVPAPWSMARGVRQLLPGEVLQWRADLGSVRRVGAAMPTPARPGDQLDEPMTEEALEELLVEVVRSQLVSDVPVGVLLSGGVDSSVVAAAAARAGAKLQTFSIVHPDPAYDERESARAVARHLGTEHHELELTPGQLSEDELQSLLDRFGDPFADSSALAMRRLAHLVRQHVTVALSGDGGDELMAGYPRYAMATKLQQLAGVPRPLRSIVAASWRASRWLPSRPRELARRVARAGAVTNRSYAQQAFATKTFLFADERDALLLPHLRGHADLDALVRHRLGPRETPPDPWYLHAIEQRVILPDEMLPKVDRMSMDASLEIRPALLDDRIVAAAARLPFEDKLQGGETKSVLKRIARRWVPPEVVDRPKRGFALPFIAYGGELLREQGDWALNSASSPLHKVFTPEALRRLHRGLEDPRPASPEDSIYRQHTRRWMLVLLARSLEQLGVELY